jgi:hypothetical protein
VPGSIPEFVWIGTIGRGLCVTKKRVAARAGEHQILLLGCLHRVHQLVNSPDVWQFGIHGSTHGQCPYLYCVAHLCHPSCVSKVQLLALVQVYTLSRVPCNQGLNSAEHAAQRCSYQYHMLYSQP